MARQLAASTLERFHKRLEQERAELEALLEEQREELEEARLAQASSDRSAEPANAESGSAAAEFETAMSMVRNLEQVLTQIEDALDRIDQGTYGICVECGKPIPVERLDALPYTRFCVACASKR